MKVTQEGNELVIRIEIEANPQPSASGKTLGIASTHGNQTTAIMIQGKPLVIGLNAYIKR